MIRLALYVLAIIVISVKLYGQTWARSKPNIIFILTDDLGYGDLSCYGNQNFKTPELDSLAQTGIRFSRFYSMNTVCSPSRAGLLTGQYPIRLGIADVFFPESYTGIGKARQSLAKNLKSVGYQTACIGKWHLGHHERHLPKHQGFDYYYGLPYSNDMKNLSLLEQDSVVVEEADNNQLTTLYTDKALNWLEQQRNKGPFFLYLAHNAPHIPLGVSKAFEGKSGYNRYGDVITEIDYQVGRIVKWLKANQLYNNTVIVFTSDNGPWLVYGPESGSAGDLREGKQTSYEGGIRVPCIVSWPAKVKGGQVSNEMAMMADWFSTFSSWAGMPQSKIQPTDGQNIEMLLKGLGNKQPRELASYYGGRLEAYIYGSWKVHKPMIGKPGTANNTPQKKQDWQLYNLDADPGERINLAPSNQTMLKEMQDRLSAFEARMGPLPKKMKVR